MTETLLARNVAALAAAQSIPAERITSAPACTRLARVGSVDVLEMRRGDDWIALNSRRDPIGEAGRWLTDALAGGPPPALIVVIGAGLGYVMDALDRFGFGARVLALEPSCGWARSLLEHRDWSDRIRSGGLRVLVGPDYSGAADVLWMFDASGPPLVLVNPVLAHEQPDAVASAQHAAARTIFSSHANRAARTEQAGRYLLNTLRNIDAIAREAAVDRLGGLLGGRPAVIVSAGPSLDQSLDQLRAFADRCVMIAVDTALRPLLSADITPHFVVTLDPTRGNAEHLLDLPDASRVALVAEASVHRAGLSEFAGRTFIFRVDDHHPWPWLSSLGLDRGRLHVWGSVATAALDVGRLLGCDPIIFCGQDLAYTDGRSYCSGTTWDNFGTPPGKRLEIAAVDIHGRPTTTAEHLVSFRDWLVDQSALDCGRRYINSSAGGILHGGRIERLPLAVALAAQPPLDGDRIRERIRSAHVGATPAFDGRASVAALAEALARDEQPDPIPSWLEFAGAHTPRGAIASALRGAANVSFARRCSPPPLSVADRMMDAFDWRPTTAPAPTRAELVRLTATIAAIGGTRLLVLNPGNGLTTLLAAAALPHGQVDVAPLSEKDLPGTAATVRAACRRAGIAPAICWLDDGSIGGCFDQIVLNWPPTLAAPDDLPRAAALLKAGGTLHIVDWAERVVGSDVARAVMACLEQDPDLVHVPAGGVDLRSRLTSLRRLETSTPAAARAASPFPATPRDAHTLADLVMRVLRPASITATGPAARFWLEPFRALPSIATAPNLDRYDVVLAMGAMASVPVDEEAEVLDQLAQVGDTIVLELPTPGLERVADRRHRPIGYWAARFLDRGFVLSDELRAAIEDSWNTARDSYSFAVLYVARRLSADARIALQSAAELRSAILDQATRIEELSVQSARLRLECQAGGARSPGFTVPSVDIDAIPEDIEPAGGHCFVWRFGRPALRLCQRAGLLRHATMHEDDVTLPLSHTLAADVQEHGFGRYIVRTDAIYFSSSDNSDPRTNGRRYAMRVPADVARLAGLA